MNNKELWAKVYDYEEKAFQCASMGDNDGALENFKKKMVCLEEIEKNT